MIKFITTTAILLSIFHFTNAQTARQISGQVKDAVSGESLPGVNVFLKEDNATGTVTDANGNYSLSVPSTATMLIFRSVGYSEKEIQLGTQNKIDVLLDVANVSLNAIVVSASRKQEKILDAPASISLITSEQIKNTVAISPAQNLKGIPGIDIMNTGLVQTNIVVRGFNNIFSGALLTMVDNRYATVPSLRVNINMFIPTDNTDLERIEVLRGPASALYGPDCADGVMHMITKSPFSQDKKFFTTVSAGIGFRGKINDTIKIANPVDPATALADSSYIPQFDFDNIGDRMMYSASVRNSGKINEHFGYKILATYFSGTDWKYDDPFEPNYVLLGKQTAAGRVNEGDSILNERNYTIKKLGLDATLDYRTNNNGEFIFANGITNNDDIELTGIGAGQAIGWKYYYSQLRYNKNNFFAQVFLNGSNSGNTYLLRTGDLIIDRSKVFAAQVQNANDILNKKMNLVYGLDALITHPDTQNTINGSNENDDDIIQVGAYIQDEYKLNDHVSLIGALREDYHNFVKTPFLSPRAAIQYKPNQKQTFRLTYNRAFSAPSSNNLNLDILQLQDFPFSDNQTLGEFAQSVFAMDYVPEIGVRAVGNREGFTYSYDDNGLPQYISPYSAFLGNAPNQYYDLNSNDELNNLAWDLAVAAVVENFNAAIPGLFVGNQVRDRYLPDDISNISNSIGLLNLTTSSFEIVDPANIHDYSAIKNQITNTYEAGWKGSFANDKIFATVDVYLNQIKDFVGPLTDITPNVFLNETDLTNYLSPIITANFIADTTLVAGLITSFLDPVSAGGNGNGTGVDELIPLIVGAASGIPFGTVSPTQYANATKYVTYVNLGNVTVAGADFGFSFYATDNLTVSLSYSWVDKDSVPLEGAQLGYVALNAPKNKVGIRVSYDINKLDLNVGLNFRWQSSYPANSGAYVGTVEQIDDLDVTLNYRPRYIKDIQFSLLVTNVYNNEQQYFIGAPVIGRTTFFKVTKSF